jgi:N-acetylmuramoyl-L-alanine amidase
MDGLLLGLTSMPEISRRLVHNLLLLASVTAVTATADAREHGKSRDAASIVAIVIHTVGGPACKAAKVEYQPIEFRKDDADFWRRIMQRAPYEAHFVIGRGGDIANIMPITEIANHTLGINPVRCLTTARRT